MSVFARGLNLDVATLALAAAAIAGAAFVFMNPKRSPAHSWHAAQYGMIAVAMASLVAALGFFMAAEYPRQVKEPAPTSVGSPRPVQGRFLAQVFLLAPDDPIKQVYKSFGLIVLSRRDGDKSHDVCTVMLNSYYGGVYSAARRLDDVIYRIKPVYWPIESKAPDYDAGCDYLLARYDLVRAVAIKDRLKLRGDGPFLVTAQFREGQYQLASLLVYDLSDVPDDEVFGSFKEYLDAYVADQRLVGPKTATSRQRIKSIVLAFSTPISNLFGVKPQ